MDSHDNDILGGEDFSPNIKNPSDEQDQAERLEAERKAAERKARETVVIDGIAFNEREISYHSKDIQRNNGKDLFLNVEGAERRKRAAQATALKNAVAEKENAERRTHDLERSIAEREHAEAKKQAELKAEATRQAAAQKAAREQMAREEAHREEIKKQVEAKQREESKKQAEEARHRAKIIEKEMIEAKIASQANEQKRIKEGERIDREMRRLAEKQEKAALRRQNRTARRAKRYAIFWQGGHKFITIGIILLIIIGIAALVFVISAKQRDAQRAEQEKVYIEKTLDFEGKLEKAGYLIDNNRLSEAMVIYEEMLSQNISREEKITIYVHRSKALYKSQDYRKSHREQAIKDANTAFEIDNNSTKALLWLIELYNDIGDRDKVKYYQELYDAIVRENAENDKKNNQNDIGQG